MAEVNNNFAPCECGDTNKDITHVVFDMDGLLLNTEDIYTELFDQLVRKHSSIEGAKFTMSCKRKLMGKKLQESLTIIVDEYNITTVTTDEMEAELKEKWQPYFEQSILMPGAENLVNHLHKHRIPISLASGSGEQAYEMKTMQHKHVFDLFHHVVLSGTDPEVQRGKPDPQGFQVATARFKTVAPPLALPKCRCSVLIFEDAPNGVYAARAAGAKVVWVPSIPSEDGDPRDTADELATLKLKSLEEFKPEVFGLPAFD